MEKIAMKKYFASSNIVTCPLLTVSPSQVIVCRCQISPQSPVLFLAFSSPQLEWSTSGNRRRRHPLYCSLSLNCLKMLASQSLLSEKLENCSFLALSLVQTLKEYSPSINISTKQPLHTATYVSTKLTLIVQNLSLWKGHLRSND